MSESSTAQKKFKLPTEVVVALLGLLGVGLTAYFSYLPKRDSLRATQTAEARLTQIALSVTAPATKITPTRTPTEAATPTITPTKTQTRTPSITPTKKGRPEGLIEGVRV